MGSSLSEVLLYRVSLSLLVMDGVDENMTREKLLIRAGTGQTYEKFSRSMLDKGHNFYLAGEGRIQHFKKDKKLVIYSMTGEHKLTYILLKEKFPDYHTVWRDG